MTLGLTRRQHQLLNHIKAYAAEGLSPSYDELCRDMGITGKGAISQLIHQLEERGLIERMPNRARSIRVLGDMEGLEKRSTADLRALKARIDELLLRRLG
jgi:repressor LexA